MSKENNINQATTPITICIMSIFALSMSLGSIQPAMNKLMEFYGEQGISMTTTMYLTSLPQLISMVGSSIAGIISGRFLSFKASSIIGILLLAFGGILPTFFSDFSIVLLFRMIFGFGFGFIMVLGNPLVSAFYEGDKKAKMLSIGSFMSFVGAMLMQVLSGIFADISLNLLYLTHLVAIIPLVLIVLFLKEPLIKKENKVEKNSKREALPLRVIFIAVIFGLTTLCVMPLYINASVLVSKVNTLSTVSAVILVIYTLGNAIGSLSFIGLYKYCKRFSLGISCAILAVGMIIMLNVYSIPFMGIAMFIAGFGYGGVMPASLSIVGQVTKPSQIAFGTSIIFVGMNVLGFLATPFTDLIGRITGDSLVNPIIFGAVLILLVSIFLLIINPFPNVEKKEEAITEYLL